MARGKRERPVDEAEQDDIVRAYLSLLEVHPSRRGRRRSPEKLQQRIDELAAITPADPLEGLLHIQERLELQAELDRLAAMPDLARLEERFVAVAGGFAKRRGISYTALREAGVPTTVLRRAGLRGDASPSAASGLGSA